MGIYFFLNLATAVAYAALGWLSLKIAIPPDYVALVFMPAGLALGVVLVWGWRLLPGVFVGSLLVQWIAHLQSGVIGWGPSLWVPALGAALQAGATAWAVWRWSGYPNPMDTPSRVLLFMVVLAPLGSMVNASVSVPTLVADGVIPAAEASYSWWTWWFGDALGAALFAPLVLVLFGEPASAWRPRLRTVALPMAVAIGLTALAVYQLRSAEERQVVQAVERDSREIGRLLQRRLDAQTDSVAALATLMSLSDRMSPDDFRAATQNWLSSYKGTQNFGWSPQVSQAERAAYESGLSQTHGQTLGILGRQTDGRTTPAPDKTAYLPITWVEPLETNHSVLGLDVLVLPATAQAVKASIVWGRPEITQGLRLVQEPGEQRGVVMYHRVLQPGAALANPDLPDPRLKGVVSAVFRMDDVVNAALGDSAPDRLRLCLVDTEAPPDNQRLYGPAGCQADPLQRLQQTVALRFGERQWNLHLSPGPAYFSQGRHWTSWASVAIGLGAVALLGAFLLVITGQGRRTQRLVDLRTHELAQSNASLMQLAHFDPLTGLANRNHWMSQARAALETAQQQGDALGVMFLDLDRFKHVNDSLGHSQGDELLKTLAQRMTACLRARDVLARLGGDEFVVLLPRLRERDGAAVAAGKIIKALSEPVRLGEHEVTVSASLGLAFYPGDGHDIDTLLRHADTAMYAAKDAGRNGWRFFSSDMNEHLSDRMRIESGLRRALAAAASGTESPETAGELYLEYQPQVDARTEAVIGVEALVRWRDPEMGLVSPERFIPVAEDSGLIEPLGRWVLSEACRQLQRWREEGLGEGLVMAVNVSALEFNRADFLRHLRKTLDDSGARADQLEIEITESLLMQAQPDLLERLQTLTGWGVTLALDDFGTGYSSLGYLKRLPLRKLKVDRSFVTDVPGNPEDEAIIRATLSMAHDLGLQVVAEGVETPAQRDFLLRHRCDVLQGWLYARAMPSEQLATWLREHPPRTALPT